MNAFKVSLSERGQIVIPADIRKKFKTREFLITYDEGKIIMSPNNTQEQMKTLVSKLTEMNKKYGGAQKEHIDVIEEIKKGGA